LTVIEKYETEYVMNDYKDLEVWKTGLQLALQTYSLTKRFPADERYCLALQMKRAAGSIIANIAEGSRQPTRLSFHRFVRISYGSASELETHSILATKLGFIKGDNLYEYNKLLTSVLKMLNSLSKSLSQPTNYKP
jgi:four helix bundle protein